MTFRTLGGDWRGKNHSLQAEAHPLGVQRTQESIIPSCHQVGWDPGMKPEAGHLNGRSKMPEKWVKLDEIKASNKTLDIPRIDSKPIWWSPESPVSHKHPKVQAGHCL